jgi:hypothetical protein
MGCHDVGYTKKGSKYYLNGTRYFRTSGPSCD